MEMRASTSDGQRETWDVSGPLFSGWEIYHMKSSPADPNRIAWEWSLVAIVMLLVSPQTAFEYCLLAISAFSYVLVRLMADLPRRAAPWMAFAATTFLVANILPRQIQVRFKAMW